MEKKKTVVDILYKFLYEMESFEGFDPYSFNQEEVFTKAKQMEKEQIGLAFIIGYAHGSVDSGLTAKEYYSERYEDKAENND